MAVLLTLAAVFSLASATDRAHLRQGRGVIEPIKFKNRLRICNAFAYEAALCVYLNEQERITGNTPMNYKICRDFDQELSSGDKLQFNVGDAVVGTFAVTSLPSQDSVLLLVIHRRDVYSTAVAFESHIFPVTNSSTQIAVLDAFEGGDSSTPVISDAKAPKGEKRSEEVRYQSVLSVSPGEYEMSLRAGKHMDFARAPLVALPGECYVVIRTGIAAYNGRSYPQEIVVYPESDPALLPHKSSAVSVTASFATMLALVTLWH